MKGLFYRLLAVLSAILGGWVVSFFTWIITTGYFILLPKRTAGNVRFYKALFPEKGWPYHLCCAWRQYHHFSTVFVDRLRFTREGRVDWSAEGREAVLAAARDKRNGIFLTTHFGNWEAAARGFTGLGIKLLLYMGTRQYEQVEAQVKKDLADHGVKVIAIPQGENVPFNGIEGLHFLKDEGFVAMAGDLLWGSDQRTITVTFLGRKTLLPQAPYAFALVTGAPIFVFFVIRTGRAKYRIVAHPPIYVRAESRDQRGEAMLKTAQQYVALLEKTIRQHPDHWYHFAPIWADDKITL